jgi:hypothetical protein
MPVQFDRIARTIGNSFAMVAVMPQLPDRAATLTIQKSPSRDT